MEPFNWQCPYCGHHSTITEQSASEDFQRISTSRSKHGLIAVSHFAVACPNPDCTEVSLEVGLHSAAWNYSDLYLAGTIHSWRLLPRSRAKPQPEYIPEAIRNDYTEACLILEDSPKASATMSRRCLQGIVRDFWKLPENQRGNLGAELNKIKDKVDPSTWDAITEIREIGDIGAHMEKDVNFVVEVEPDEASLLVELIEVLLADWYVARHSREQRDQRVQAIAQKKRDEKREAKLKSRSAQKEAGPTGTDTDTE